jgi:hypothetical protein
MHYTLIFFIKVFIKLLRCFVSVGAPERLTRWEHSICSLIFYQMSHSYLYSKASCSIWNIKLFHVIIWTVSHGLSYYHYLPVDVCFITKINHTWSRIYSWPIYIVIPAYVDTLSLNKTWMLLIAMINIRKGIVYLLHLSAYVGVCICQITRFFPMIRIWFHTCICCRQYRLILLSMRYWSVYGCS